MTPAFDVEVYGELRLGRSAATDRGKDDECGHSMLASALAPRGDSCGCILKLRAHYRDLYLEDGAERVAILLSKSHAIIWPDDKMNCTCTRALQILCNQVALLGSFTTMKNDSVAEEVIVSLR